MLNEEKATKILTEIYTKLYKESKPSASFKEIIKSGEGLTPDWFKKYYLNQERQNEIVIEICKKYKLTKRDSYKVSCSVHLGYAPSCVKPKYQNRCPECGRFGGYANPELLKIVKMEHGYVCEKCMLVFEAINYE
jgi:hypothetical protein